MYAILGLGNPGDRYRHTRHNVGREVVEALVRTIDEQSRQPVSGAWQHKFNCALRKADIGATPCLFVLPETYMNLSGEAAVPALAYFKIESPQIIVVHDDLDLDPGAIIIKRGGSAAGNHGVENLVKHLGTSDFIRIRLGIGNPRRIARELSGQRAEQGDDKRMLALPDVRDWVLGRPGPAERELLEASGSEAAQAIQVIVSQNLEEAIRRFNRRGAAGKSGTAA